MQNKRSRIIWFVAIAIAFFFIMDPFRLFENNNIPQMRVNQEVEQQMIDFLSSAPDATSFVVDSFDSHDLVMIGETGYAKQQLEFLMDLIPVLDDAGIRHLAYQYASWKDQNLVDRLITATSFDESLANEILFNNMVIMGYEEYRAVFRTAWQVNRSKAEGEEPFRIVAIGHAPDYTPIQEQDDVEDPEILRQVFAAGVPDELMARTIIEQIVEPGHKAVAYTKLENAFTDFQQSEYSETMAERGFPNQKRTGGFLADRLGNRVMTAIFHTPLPDGRSRFGYGYPVGGLMEKAWNELPEGHTAVGFTVADAPYAEAPISSDVMSSGRDEDLTFEQFTDGYLMIGLIGEYESVTPIEGFITERNIARARAEFPGADPGDVSPQEMNEYIAGTASSMGRIFDEFAE